MRNLIQGTKVLTLMLMLVSIVLSPFARVHAETVLPLNGTTNGVLLKDQEVVYSFVLSATGKMSFDLSSLNESARFQLTDDQGKLIFTSQLRSDGKTPDLEMNTFYLEPRSYRLTVKDMSYYGRMGNYSITTKFTEMKTQDVEPNNGTTEAQSLSFGKKIRGFLSEQDDRDVYKVTLPKSGKLSLDFSSYLKRRAVISLTNDLNEKIWNKDLTSSELTPGKAMESFYLEQGTYYFTLAQIDPYYESGVYDVTFNFQATNNNELEPNNGVIEAMGLSFYKNMTGLLSWSDTEDYYKVVVPKKSNVTLDLSSYVDSAVNVEWMDDQNNIVFKEYVRGDAKSPGRLVETRELLKGTYYLRVNSDVYTGLYKFKVKSSHLLPALAVNAVKSTSTKVSGTTQKNIAVTMKVGKKTYTGKSNSKGQFSFKINKQKVGTILHVTSKNQYGSTYKTVTVRK